MHTLKKKFLSLALSGVMILGNINVAFAAGPTFEDMPTDWSRPAMEKAVENGLLNGSNGKINPAGLLSRAEMATVVTRAFGAEAKADLSNFSDVAPAAWYYEAMQKAVAMGVISGNGNALNSEAPITRQETMVILARAFCLTAAETDALNQFEDRTAIAPWAKSAAEAMVSMGYITGDGKGHLNPGATITRAEFAKIMDNLVKAYPQTSSGAVVEGNALIRNDGVTLTGATIQGDLMIADGVGGGNVTLKDTAITGRLLVRGGGINSIHLEGSTAAAQIVIAAPTHGVRVVNSTSGKLDGAVVGGKGDVVLTGAFGTVTVDAPDAKVTLTDATAELVLVAAANVAVTVSGKSDVAAIQIAKTAENATVTVQGKAGLISTQADNTTIVAEKGASVQNVESAAANTTVSGAGKVSKAAALAGATGTVVSTAHTAITVDKAAGAVKTNTGTVKPGSTGNSNGSGSSGNGSESVGTIQMDTLPDLELALGSTSQIIPAAVASNGKPVTLSATSSATGIATVVVNGTTLTMTALTLGESVITLKATAENCGDVERTFKVTVLETTSILYNGEMAAPILMDAPYMNSAADQYAARTYAQILRAVGDLRQDIAMVTGAIDDKEVQQLFVDGSDAQAQRLAQAEQIKVPQLVTSLTDVQTNYAIIVGDTDSSPVIKALMEAGKLDEAKDIKDEWEAYVIKEVADPMPGVKNALVIAGSDARGTIFGIYTLSEAIGVSPYYWYSDVPVAVRSEVDVDYTTALVEDGPDVKYRGIFINDEEFSIRDWAKKKFPTENGTPDVNYYRHVFEMMLRLRSNFIWPAMHDVATSFNVATDENGVPINSKEAAKYGVVVGSTHCDILLRTNTGEWEPWYNANKEKLSIKGKDATAAYDFSINEEVLLQYWRERLETNKDFESVLTLGIRGVHDSTPIWVDKAKYDNSAVKFMEEVIKAQRKLIDEVYGAGASKTIPQVLIPYKEIGDLYNEGLKGFLAQEEYEDITLMWAEDNYGYLRQTSTDIEKDRTGGAGVYYHTSYYGSPTCYLWLNTIQLSLMNEQMLRAYDEGMQDQWMLNVGDIKPGDQSIEYFLEMAWDVEKYREPDIQSQYLKEQALRDYRLSGADAETVTDAMNEYYQIIGTKRPEFYTTATKNFDLSATSNGDEALLWLERCNAVVDKLSPIYDKLDDDTKSAFYQQLYYHALSIQDVAEEYVYYWKNIQAVNQGRVGSSQVYIELSKAAAQKICDRINDYGSVSDGKWAGYIHWKHVDDRAPEERNHDIIQDGDYAVAAALGVGAGAACEGQIVAGSGTLRFNSLAPSDERYFDVFSKEVKQVEWCAETSADWIKLSRTEGATSTEQRVVVTVDWSKLAESADGMITVYNAENGQKTGESVAVFTVTAILSNVTFGNTKGFVEANGYVAAEAEHYSELRAGSDGSTWGTIISNAQHGDTMKTYPDHGTSASGAGAALVYNVYFEQEGTYNGTLYRVPTLNEGTEDDGTARSCKVMVSANGQNATLTGNRAWGGNAALNNPTGAWGKNVMRMYESLTFKVTVTQGWNTIELTRLDPSIVIDRFVIETVSGALGASFLGPVESPNNIVQGSAVQTAKVAALPEELANAVILPDMVMQFGDAPAVYDGLEGFASAVSEEQRVATVAVEDGKIVLTALRAGTARITAEMLDGARRSFKLTVNRVETTAGGVYEQANPIVINAVDALEQGTYAYTSGTATHIWELDGVGIHAAPDIGDVWTDTTLDKLEGTAPAVNYRVQITDAGDYYLFLNTSHPNGGADSYHVAVDESYRYVDKALQDGKETWYSAKKKINLTAGEHTITVYAREDGFRLNQLALTKDSGMSLVGLQTPSSRAVAGPKITLSGMDDFSLTTVDSAREVTVSAEASNGAAVTLNVESNHADYASVSEVVNSKFTVTPVAVGGAKITVTASADGCTPAQGTFIVTVTAPISEDDQNKAYQEAGGVIVINAVDALIDKPYAASSDISVAYQDTDFAWVEQTESDHKSLQLTPAAIAGDEAVDGVSKWAWTQTAIGDLSGKVPSLTYKVYVASAGSYYFSFYGNTPNANSDSFHIVANDTYQFQTGDKTSGYGIANGDQWFLCKKAISLNAGINTITIYARESGIWLRQLMLTTAEIAQPENKWYDPSLLGEIPAPAEAVQGTASKKEAHEPDTDAVQDTKPTEEAHEPDTDAVQDTLEAPAGT